MAERGRPPIVLLTCEHGGNAVPSEYRRLFRGRERLLATHRGLDIGAAAAARHLRRALGCELICASVTRLLVDLNRSPGHPALFSELTRGVPAAERRRILERHYRPYRNEVAAWLAARIDSGARVLHVSVHSFTPRLHGKTRRADVGLLYDPARAAEARFCGEWQRRLIAADARWTVRRNYPYRGTSDGLVVDLRRRFAESRYVGMELEINQARLGEPRERAALMRVLAASVPVEAWP